MNENTFQIQDIFMKGSRLEVGDAAASIHLSLAPWGASEQLATTCWHTCLCIAFAFEN